MVTAAITVISSRDRDSGSDSDSGSDDDSDCRGIDRVSGSDSDSQWRDGDPYSSGGGGGGGGGGASNGECRRCVAKGGRTAGGPDSGRATEEGERRPQEAPCQDSMGRTNNTVAVTVTVMPCRTTLQSHYIED